MKPLGTAPGVIIWPSMSLIAGTKLGPYEIVEPLGAGGMGEVYRAHDERLDRDVALKVLPAGVLADEIARKRFRKEALALAKLCHPNICMIFDFDMQDGVDFLAMEYVAGQSLAQKVNAASLPEKEVVTLGAQLAAALEEAHEQRIVHCDLKPGNILVTPKGQAKVLDFGLAKLLRAHGDPRATQTFTETHGVAGTLPYMSPEQLRGEGLDVRTDIYALGCVLYEMATGRRAFPENSVPRLTDAILHQAPVGPRAVNGRVSPQLEAIILKCLEKEAEHRYQSAKEASVDLRRLAFPTAASGVRPARISLRKIGIGAAAGVVAILLLLVALNVAGLRERSLGKSRGTPEIRSLAVLPLENLSGDPEQEYFTDGMTEALIAQLSEINSLNVISRTSVMQYKGTRKPLPRIARELGVDGVIEGSVLREGNEVRVTVQLIQGATDRLLWAHNYQRELQGILGLQSEVAKAIAAEMRLKLTPNQEALLSRVRTVNPTAQDAYLRGRYSLERRDLEELKKAQRYFQKAIDIDPAYAIAYAGLAEVYVSEGSWAVILPSNEAMPRAEAAAKKALELDDTLAEAHNHLAEVRYGYYWDWLGADREYQRVFELNSSYADAHRVYGQYLSDIGHHDQAIKELNRAVELDPLSPLMATDLGLIYYRARKQDQAIQEERKVLQIDPAYERAHLILALALAAERKYAQALPEFERAGQLGRIGVAYVYALTGRENDARRMLAGELQWANKVPAILCMVPVGLGDSNAAFELLDKAYEMHDYQMSSVKVEPYFDPLRPDPRFQGLLQRMNFPP